MTYAAPALLAADWGTTNFRLFLFGTDGKIIAKHTANIGLKNLGVLTFEQALLSVMKGDFDRPNLPVLLSGMVGSRTGWAEAPYVACPASLEDITNGLVTAPSEKLNVKIVPGLNAPADHEGLLNVMRGEETQLFGLSATLGDGVFVLPGTHSKWAKVESGIIDGFSSYMTGEMFQVADKSFLSLVFSVRTEGLFGHIAPESLSSYLSGLLIGSEIRAESIRHGIRPVGIVGDGTLSNLYKRALLHTGFTDVTIHDGDTAAAAGLWAIAQQGKLVL